ncbi:MAG TPA: hypothetical protein [Caudoviricetes sp.]|nr:MAG TPA: hypothetical protein [Caudoviricetes sp.]
MTTQDARESPVCTVCNWTASFNYGDCHAESA